MLSLDLKNLSLIDSTHGLSSTEINSKASLIKLFLQKIHSRHQAFYTSIDDQTIITKINDFVDSKKHLADIGNRPPCNQGGKGGVISDLVLLGIGGSALGPICLQQSLKHLFENELATRPPCIQGGLQGGRRTGTPRLHVLDNIDPTLITELEDIIDYESTLFLVITKSGTTPETLAQYFYFRKKCDDQNLDPTKHFVFITDPSNGFLRKIGQEKKIPLFDIPANIGGRFSVLTNVGLLPAKLIGIDIEKLLIGAKQMRDSFLNENFDQNLPFQLATIQYLLNQKGKTVNVMMPYAQKLIRFADWYRQLLAESIGKAVNEKGETVNIGLTPVNALGVTDQHSQSQLYNEGPNDKFFIFIEVENLGSELKIPSIYPNEKSVDYLKNVTFNQLIKTEMQGVVESLTHNNRPSITIRIPQINEETLGQLFMLFMAATAFLGEYFGINAFDQPGVELSKKLTRKMLVSNN